MIYDANLSTLDLEIERLRPERRRHGPRNTNNLIPAVEMIIGDWHVDAANAGRLALTLAAERDRAMLFRTLATLRTDIPLFRDVDELKFRGSS